MKRSKSTLILLVILVFCQLFLFGCGEKGNDEPEASAAPTASPTPEKQYGKNEYGVLEGDEQAEYAEILPGTLPDGSEITTWLRPYCLDDYIDSHGYHKHYSISGNSSATLKIVDKEGGAVYGTAFKIEAHGKTPGEDRGEFEVYCRHGANVKGAKGILFYVDLSSTVPQTGEDCKPLCASVTMNTNTYRSNKDDNASVGYYYKDGKWNETKNVVACRMQVPEAFKGWMYIPADSFVDNAEKTPITDENGCFNDINVDNMRCYSDGYVYSADDSSYVLFDEILFIY